MRLARLGVDSLPDVLEDCFFVTEILAGLTIELPQHAVFSNRKDEILPSRIDEHAFEHDIEIEASPGACETYQASLPVSASMATVELVKRTAPCRASACRGLPASRVWPGRCPSM